MNKSDAQFTYPLQTRSSYSRNERIGLASLGIFLFCLLAIAAWLKPDPAGMGTHTQLGLPGCTMKTYFGIRCPGCGMTTSWAHVMNGDFELALQSSVAGVLLCFISYAASPALIWQAIRGMPFPNSYPSTFFIVAVLAAVGISFFEWMIRLALR